MIRRESRRGSVRLLADDESISLRNLSGMLHVSLKSGAIAFYPEFGRPYRHFSGRVRIRTDRKSYESGGGRSIQWEIEALPGPFDAGITVHFRQSLQEGDSSLHWRISAMDGCFILRAGVGGLEGGIRRMAVFDSDDFVGSIGEVRMLCLAYCGAHTGRTLSMSRVCSLAMDTSAESWWATVFLPRLGPSMAMGFLSASRFAGKIEAERGKVRMFNFAEGVSGSSPDTVWSEPFYVSFNPDPSAAVEGYASMAAASAGARIRHSPVFGWGSWSNYHDSINEKTVLENANHFVGVVPSAKNRAVIEVDHGWEERISTHRPETCWTARREFSADLPAMIGRVHDAMLKNGLWVVPFAVNEGSRHLDAHKEYLVRDETGRPMRVGGKGKGYCVDPTHPDGERWLRELFSRLMRLGIDYFKMDYLRVLLAPEPSDPKDSLDVKRVYWNGATRVEAYRHGLGIIRDTVGEAVYLLACGAPSLPSAGLIDGFRVGQDIAIAWNDGRTGIRDCARNIACNYFWHKRLWRNDPDYLVLPRENNLRRFWATAVALSGGSVIVSADLSTLDSSQEHDLNAVMPPWGESAAPMEWGEDDFPAKWCLPVTAHGESYYLVGFLNGDESPRLFHMDARDLDWPEPPGHFIAWNFWGMEMMGESSGPFSITVPGRDVGLFCVRSLRSHPMLAGTSLHYTMGAVELDKVEWSSVDLSLTCDLSECAPRKGFLYFHVPDSYLLRSKSSGRKTTQGGVLTVPVGEGRSTSIRLEFRKAGEGGR